MIGSDRSRLQPPSEYSCNADSVQAAVGRETGGVARKIGMALAGERHVELARQPDAHGPPRLPGAERGDGGKRVGLHFLAAERAAHAQALDRHLIRGTPSTRATTSCVSDGCCVDEWTATNPALIDPREGGLRLEVEMLLAADPQLALDTSASCASIAATYRRREPKRLGEETVGVDGLLDRQDGRQRLDTPLSRARRRAWRRPASRPAPTRPAGGETSPRAGTAARRGDSRRCRLRRARRLCVSTVTTPGSCSAGDASSSVTGRARAARRPARRGAGSGTGRTGRRCRAPRPSRARARSRAARRAGDRHARLLPSRISRPGDFDTSSRYSFDPR